jgi:hypothetical protein
MTKRRREHERRPGRRAPFLEPKPLILIVCEGVVTEKQYLLGYARTRRAAKFRVDVANKHGVPKTLVGIAKDWKIDAERRARHERDAFLEYDEVWCIFDVDEHPDIGDAIQMARDNHIELAISNPCFELWLLLHFRDCPGMEDRRSIQAMLKTYLPKYDKRIDFEDFKPHCEAAVRRAVQLDQLAKQINELGRNPTTGVYKLLRKIGDESEGE